MRGLEVSFILNQISVQQLPPVFGLIVDEEEEETLIGPLPMAHIKKVLITNRIPIIELR